MCLAYRYSNLCLQDEDCYYQFYLVRGINKKERAQIFQSISVNDMSLDMGLSIRFPVAVGFSIMLIYIPLSNFHIEIAELHIY